MARSSTCAFVVPAFFLAACAVLAPKDLTPVNPTAVLETHIVSAGMRDLPALESTTLTFTRANMQRNESSVKGTGVKLRFLDGETDVRIERADRKLVWTLDTKNKKAIECPLKNCSSPISRAPPLKKSTGDDKTRDPGCRLKIGNTALTAESTGRKRTINGFDTEQYDIKWLVTFRDNAARKSISTISIDVWTTPVTPALTDTIALEKTYARARDKVTGTESAADQTGILPPEVARMINAYLFSSVKPTDRANLLSGANKLDNVRGHPILMNIQWTLAGEACSMSQTMKDTSGKPLITFTSEVKAHKMADEHDSLFAPPTDYKITK